jgi:hypothetical protein
MPRPRLVRLLAVLAALALFVASCGDDGEESEPDTGSTLPDDSESSTTAPTTTATVPEGGEAITGVSLTEVVFGADGHVTLTNSSDAEVSVDGLWLCNRPAYTALTGTIAAGGTLEVTASELGGLSVDGGEAALYTAQDFESSDAIIDYVQWGSGGGREGVAVAAGIWDEGGSVEPDPDFGAIEYFDASFENSAGAWE